MARFTLKPNRKLKDLGKAIIDLAALQYKLIRTTDLQLKSDIEQQLINAEDIINNDILEVNPTTVSVKDAQIVYHYDGIDSATGEYVLHIVVPDLDGKEVDQETFSSDDFDLTDFATECMGHIIIFGCGR